MSIRYFLMQFRNEPTTTVIKLFMDTKLAKGHLLRDSKYDVNILDLNIITVSIISKDEIKIYVK